MWPCERQLANHHYDQTQANASSFEDLLKIKWLTSEGRNTKPAMLQLPREPSHLHLPLRSQQRPPPPWPLLRAPRVPPPAARRARDKVSSSRSSIQSRCRKQS